MLAENVEDFLVRQQRCLDVVRDHGEQLVFGIVETGQRFVLLFSLYGVAGQHNDQDEEQGGHKQRQEKQATALSGFLFLHFQCMLFL